MESCEWERERELADRLAKHGPTVRDGLRIPADLAASLTADDVMQESYLAAFLALDRMPDGDTEVRAWLHRIATNTLVDAIRALRAQKRGGRHARAELGSRGESAFGGDLHTPSRAVRRGERIGLVRSAAAQLPEPYRTAAAGLLAGEAPGDLARRLGKTEGAAHMLLTRTRRMLRDSLAGSPQDYLDSE